LLSEQAVQAELVAMELRVGKVILFLRPFYALVAEQMQLVGLELVLAAVMAVMAQLLMLAVVVALEVIRALAELGANQVVLILMDPQVLLAQAEPEVVAVAVEPHLAVHPVLVTGTDGGIKVVAVAA
jgi:hypothetical protein